MTSESPHAPAARAIVAEPGRGRRATSPLGLPAKGWKDVALRIKNEMSADHVGLIAAGVAFYGVLAIFPAITALMALTGLIYEPTEIVTALEGVSAFVPNDVSDIILTQAKEVAGSQEGGLTLGLILGFGLALWSASAGVGSLIEGLNVAYDEKETRGFIHLKLLTLGMTLLMLVGVFLALGLVVLVPVALKVLIFAPWVEFLINVLKFLPLGLIFVFGVAFLYRRAPDREPATYAWLTPGAVAACGLWLIVSVGFSIYVQNFASYNESFGSVAGIIVLLTWMWLSAYIILLGAELNSELEAQTTHDTTTGEERPMGQRGAIKADRLGDAQV